MTGEGSLGAPTRQIIDWQNPDFADPARLDEEMRRVFDICHGCRRCFNLCDSFPRLFDLIDNSPQEDVEHLASEDFKPVVEACTLCDMCFMTKCPYVPPHPFMLDFPHLMLRHRFVEAKNGKTDVVQQQLAEMDRNGSAARFVSPIVNWASDKDNKLTRGLMEKTIGIDAKATLPKFHSRTFVSTAKQTPNAINTAAPAYGKRKAALYATCFVNYNKPDTGMDARAVLNHIGVETRIAYPGCCGMPFLEQAELARVAQNAAKVSKELVKLIDDGYDIVALTASCGLMLKFEWALVCPDDENVRRVARHTFDIDQYVVDVAKKDGLPGGLTALPEGVTVHLACHARAQNMGPKAAEMLKMIPDTPVDVIERCSGHGGTFGVVKPTHDVGVKVGKPVFKAVNAKPRGHIVSDCPLAAVHIVAHTDTPAREPEHPIQIMARAFGLKKMSETDRKITEADILPAGEYDQQRKSLKANLIPMKKLRRVEVGPFATFYFESYATMWLQVQEMLRIEKGGAQQLPGELAAYNPLIPQGDELIATLMLEIEDEKRRNAVLLTLGGVEETVFLEIGGDVIRATPTEYDDRTTADGKTSSVHWVRFKLTKDQIAHFRESSERVVLGVSHASYGHMAVLTAETRAALAKDFA